MPATLPPGASGQAGPLAVTGHEWLAATTPRDGFEVTMGSVDITSRTLVAAPPEAAWDVVVDFARNPQWQGGMRSCEWLTDPPVAVGSRYQQEAAFLGRTLHTTFEVVDLERFEDGGGSVTIESRESTFPLRVTRTVAAAPGGCEVIAHVTGSPDGAIGLAASLVAPLVRRSVDGDYRRLRALVEGGA